jgi:hypothetical protein
MVCLHWCACMCVRAWVCVHGCAFMGVRAQVCVQDRTVQINTFFWREIYNNATPLQLEEITSDL